jgi:amino acid adenylation domain-containing protein
VAATKNSSTLSFKEADINGSVINRFQLIAREVPDKIAVDTLTDRLTYAQLDAYSGLVATAIASHPVSKEQELVAFLIDQGHVALAAILGILKSGRAVVAFPTELPVEQLRYIWADTFNPLILTNQRNLKYVKEIVTQESHFLCMDDPALINNENHRAADEVQSRGDDLALINYTSGSTGHPKGVMLTHSKILQAAHQNYTSYQLSPADRVAVLGSFGYGAAKTQCFSALLSGATLYLPDLREYQISTLMQWLDKEKITVIAMPPMGMFRQIMDSLGDGNQISSIRMIIVGGSDLYQQDVDRFFSLIGPDVTLVFRMAGSEMGLLREMHVHPGMKFQSGKVPIGYAVPEKEIFLLDEQGREVSPGEIGEIVVRSRYLASGYWRQPELTAERFKPDPEGSDKRIYYSGDLARVNELGQMEHMGRKDNLVKIHGFSVHLETIDQVLCKLPYIKEAASTSFPLPTGDRRLVAYLVPVGEFKPPVGEIRREIALLLPEHMQPSGFVWMDELPHTSTGKVDRKSLPPAPRQRPDVSEKYISPRDELEESLAGIWKRLLQLDDVGVEDNFFDLGGDSLSSVQMVFEAERLFGFALPKSYFEKPTISNLAKLYRKWQESGDASQTTLVETGSDPGRVIPVRRVNKYQAALRKTIRHQWSFRDIVDTLKWYVISLQLDINDHSIKKSILRLPYREGLDKLNRWVSAPFVAKRLYRKQYQYFSQLLSDMDVSSTEFDSAFQASLMGNIFSRLGFRSYLRKANNDIARMQKLVQDPFWVSFIQKVLDTPIGELDDIFPVLNLEYLEQALQAGKGVILLSYHSTVNQLALLVLSRRLSLEMIPTISEKRAKMESIHWQNNYARDIPDREFAALKAGVALEGQHLLAEGRIVQFVSDNEYARQGHAVVLAGRRYFLRPGFAELALNTGAAVVPMFCSMKSDGRIYMTLQPPLIVGSGDRDSQITNLLDQYAAFLNASWKEAPESLRWPRLFRHFLQPLAS